MLPQTIKNSTTYYASIANNPELSLSLANAYKFFNKKKDECLKKHDTINAINHLRQLAIIQNELGDYLGCETNIVHALKLLNQLKETEITNESKVGLYNQIGRLNLILLKYETSLDYFKKGLKIAKHPRHINILQNNMALVYIKQLNFELAEKILAEIYEKSKTQVGAEQTTARALDNLGNVQAKLGRPVALDNLKKALKMRLEIKDNYGLYSSYSHLKEFYSDKKDVNKAVFYANQAYDVAKTVNSISYIEDALSNIISLSSDPNVLKYKQLKDSITNARQIADNKYALIKYDYLKKENEAKVDGTDYENH
ncbi:tetratricopeptide repeat protein [Mariniflexile sp.]|uniref:tetratricopeptide repeat protein n=1 Tax=Mariniflexile sp. TaxID=1979402 RepID=UPI0035663C47